MAEESMSKGSKKVEKQRKKIHKLEKASKKASTAASTLGLLADEAVDATLSSLFAVKQPISKSKPKARLQPKVSPSQEEDNDAELSEIDEDIASEEDRGSDTGAVNDEISPHEQNGTRRPKQKQKRKRNNGVVELEDVYMSKLAQEEEGCAKRLAADRVAKKRKLEEQGSRQLAEVDAEDENESMHDLSVEMGKEQIDGNDGEEDKDDDGDGDDADEGEEDAVLPPPKHETLHKADEDLAKASRTVFLGNVSTAAITCKSERKTLLNHLCSFFDKLAGPEDNTKHAVQSLRFRSTPYASAIPKKAAFAKKELMDATTKSTNAYAVYSSQSLAREAAKRLNGTVILNRHLRVDEVAHPAKVDHRRCVFVGNLGYVDDETNIQDANEAEGREKRKRGKEPADVEEGLWRAFSKCGTVESVRVIRDSTTRVGKGIAYVQFQDENAVEAALQYNEKKFPPMLPRKLRVTRAKAQKRNAKPHSARPGAAFAPGATGYQRKITSEEASRVGRASKMLGRAAAAQIQKSQRQGFKAAQQQQQPFHPSTSSSSSVPTPFLRPDGIRNPEDFIFEGHRASRPRRRLKLASPGGLKLGGNSRPKKNLLTRARSTARVTKRSASFKRRE